MLRPPIPPAFASSSSLLPCQTRLVPVAPSGPRRSFVAAGGRSLPRRVVGLGPSASAPPRGQRREDERWTTGRAGAGLRLPDISHPLDSFGAAKGRQRAVSRSIHDSLEQQRAVIERLKMQLPSGASPLGSTMQMRSAASGSSTDIDTGGIQSTYVRTRGKSYIPSVAVASLHLKPSLPIGLEATVSLARSEYVADIGETIQTNAIVSLLALSDETLCKIPRIALRVVLVLDVSSSMRGKRYKALVDAVEAIIDALGKSDKLAVVVFNDGAQLVGYYQRGPKSQTESPRGEDNKTCTVSNRNLTSPRSSIKNSTVTSNRSWSDPSGVNTENSSYDINKNPNYSFRRTRYTTCAATPTTLDPIPPKFTIPGSQTPMGKKLLNELSSREPSGTTDMLGGLMLGARTMDRMACSDTKNHIILITDGWPDSSNSTEDILNVVEQCIDHRVSVSAVGCGRCFNEDLLMEIASVGCGSYYYTDDENLKASLRNELKSLNTIVARDVKVELTGHKVAIDDVFGYHYKRKPESPAEAVTIFLGDVLASDIKRDILIGISWIQTRERRKEILDVKISYTCVASGYKEITTTLKTDIRPPEADNNRNNKPKRSIKTHNELDLGDGKRSSIIKPSPSIGMVVDKVQKVSVGNAIMDCIQKMSINGDQFALKLLRKQISDYSAENEFMTETSENLIKIISLFESRVKELCLTKDDKIKSILRMKLSKDMKDVARTLLRN